jgi:Cupin superfamily (DUF985)
VNEVWYFYGGDPLRLVLLYPDGSSENVIMGSDPLKGQYVIPAGVWQAGHMLVGGKYSLYGCTMAPGFTDDMFEGGMRDQLIELYPIELTILLNWAAVCMKKGCQKDRCNNFYKFILRSFFPNILIPNKPNGAVKRIARTANASIVCPSGIPF